MDTFVLNAIALRYLDLLGQFYKPRQVGFGGETGVKP